MQTDPEDVLHAEARVVDARPGGRERVAERVLGVSAARVDGDVPVMTGAAQRPHQRARVALIDHDVHVPRPTVADVPLELRQRVPLVVRRLTGKTVKGKGFPYSTPSVGPGADPGVQAVSLQVTVKSSTRR